MPDENDLVLMQLLLHPSGKLNAVLRHSVGGDGGGGRRSVSSEGSFGAALVPLHDGEVLQPATKGCVSPGIGRIAWPAIQEEQHRVVAVLAANRDPLLDSADLGVGGLVDSVRAGT